MSPAHVLEPTYSSLKQRLLEGTWPIGLRLDASRLAEDFGVSVTPVRDCLNRLVGERLVDFRPQEGYRVARLGERTLRDLLGFNNTLLGIALDAPGPWEVSADAWPDEDCHAGQVAALFAAIASLADNSALDDTVANLNDRLYAARSVEQRLFPDAAHDVAELTTLLLSGCGPLRERLARYHEERQKAASRLIGLLEKAPN